MAESLTGSPQAAANRRLAWRLLGATLLAFVFGYGLVPFYDVFCRLTGINGKTASQPAVAAPGAPVDLSQHLTVEFTGTAMPGLSWEIVPATARLEVHPGEIHHTTFRVSNRSAQPITGQAVPSVSPGQAASHFNKLDCFCFRQQTLAPGETRELPLTFIVTPGLTREVHTISLAYAFYNTAAATPAAP